MKDNWLDKIIGKVRQWLNPVVPAVPARVAVPVTVRPVRVRRQR